MTKPLAPVSIVYNESLILFILVAINFTNIMDFVIIAPLNPFFKEAFHINTQEFGMLVASYTLSAGISGFLGFFWVDKLDRRKALLLLYFGFMLGNTLCAIAPNFILLLSARIVAGCFGGVIGALVLSVVGDIIPPERRGKATGIVMTAFSAASVIGIPSGLMLAERYDWNAPFILLSVLSLLVFILIYFKFPSVKTHLAQDNPDQPLVILLKLLKTKNIQRALLFSIFVMLSGFTVVPYISDYMVNNVMLPKEDLRYIYLFGGIATVVSGPIVGKLADKYGKQKIFAMVGGISIIPIFLITHIGVVNKLLLFTISTTFFIFFGGRFVPAIAITTAAVEAKNRGKFMSINSSVQQLSNALATSIASVFIYNTSTGQLMGFGTVGIIACVFTITSILLSFRVKQIS
ncbi:MAG: MFS transporter [Cytophagales bacterium]|nr:MAG: MFS transporter [Cytophagales bacterium]